VCGPGFGCQHTNFEVTGARFNGKTTLTWSSRGSSAKYDVATGLGSQLSSLGNGAGESCVSDDLSGTFVTVSPSPGPGVLFWYLVRAKSGGCGVGTYGFDYQPQGLPEERNLMVCP
jgi:hypothetical protein